LKWERSQRRGLRRAAFQLHHSKRSQRIARKAGRGRLGRLQLFDDESNRIVEQLGRGAVKVPFGELRPRRSAGVFVTNRDHDSQLIDLPLAEVMRQLQPDAFVRRANQKQLTRPVKLETYSELGVSRSPRFVCWAKMKSRAPRRRPVQPCAPPQRSRLQLPRPPSQTLLVSPTLRALLPPAALSAVPPVRSSSISQTAGRPGHPGSAGPEAKNRPGASLRVERSGLTVALAAISESWPAKILAEIAELGLADATCEFPVAEIGSSLRTGR